MSGAVRLRVYRFGPDAALLGGVAGAIERSQLGIGSAVLDAVFVGRETTSGRLEALDLSTATADGSVASLLDFRLAAERRAELTERTFAAHARAVPRELIDGIAAGLRAGEALVAALVAGVGDALDEAARRSGGRLTCDEPTSARTLEDAGALVLAACTPPSGCPPGGPARPAATPWNPLSKERHRDLRSRLSLPRDPGVHDPVLRLGRLDLDDDHHPHRRLPPS